MLFHYILYIMVWSLTHLNVNINFVPEGANCSEDLIFIIFSLALEICGNLYTTGNSDS